MSNHLKTLIFGLALGLATPGKAQQTAANYLVQPIDVEFAESPASTSFVFRVQQYLENISSETIDVDMSLVRKHPLGDKVKKGLTTPEEGAKQLCRYLDCALALMNKNTGFFEEALRKAGSSGELIHLFDSITITR